MRVLHIVPTAEAARHAGYREGRHPRQMPGQYDLLQCWWPGCGEDWVRGLQVDVVIVDSDVLPLLRSRGDYAGYRAYEQAKLHLTRFAAWIEP